MDRPDFALCQRASPQQGGRGRDSPGVGWPRPPTAYRSSSSRGTSVQLDLVSLSLEAHTAHDGPGRSRVPAWSGGLSSLASPVAQASVGTCSRLGREGGPDSGSPGPEHVRVGGLLAVEAGVNCGGSSQRPEGCLCTGGGGKLCRDCSETKEGD